MSHSTTPIAKQLEAWASDVMGRRKSDYLFRVALGLLFILFPAVTTFILHWRGNYKHLVVPGALIIFIAAGQYYSVRQALHDSIYKVGEIERISASH